MILIDYEIRSSTIHGAGLFTREDIRKGALIAQASPKLDLNIPVETFDDLDDREKSEILHWGYYDEARGFYHVDFDNTKFINHSKNGNVAQDGSQGMRLVAKRDINKGEELTQDYLEFESEDKLSDRGISG